MKSPKPILLFVIITTSVIGIGLISLALFRLNIVSRELSQTHNDLQNALANMRQEVSQVRNDLNRVLSELGTEAAVLVDAPGVEPPVQFATVGEAEAVILKLGESPSADRLAEAIMVLDEWLIKSGQEEPFAKLELAQRSRLRQQVKAEVFTHQQAALGTATGAEGAKEHVEAGRILSLYPLSDETLIVEEAKSLSVRQAEIAVRLEIIRRQRYNRWSTERIGQAIETYNKNVYHVNPTKDNSHLVELLVSDIGEVDPAVLEPAVLELYNYVIERTKSSIPELNKIELAKQLTDPSIRRKVLGDF